jgi:tRNA A-37 threonylcarbamoyl transferase component Bud32
MSNDSNADRPASASDSAADPVAIGLAQTASLDMAEPTAPAPAKADPYVGKTFDGRYAIERVIGEGGMGVVYAARHKMIDKKVAIKVLRGELALDHELNERFLQEARAASAIGNPHIVDISDFGLLPDGATYFAMEFLDGKSLGALLSDVKGPVPVPRLCHIAKQISQGLSAAHAANIVHRDLKPDNVMLINRGRERDFVKILDFGIAKVGGGTKKMTRAGSVFGTPHYMSPEQAAGASVDHRTDIYALGVILYEMATGKVPFDADNFMGILTQHMYKAPVPIRALVPEIDVPPGLDAIVLKCLTKKPEGRYGTMDELIADLEKLEHGTLPDAVAEMMARSGGFNVPADYFHATGMPALVPASPREGKKRWPLYATMGAVATLLGVVGVVVARSTNSGAQTAPAGLVVATTAIPPATALAPVALPAAPVALPVAPVESVARATREVLVSVVPGDATVTRDGADLGQQPFALHLADGESATLVIARKGYRTKTVKIDGSAPRQFFALDLISAPVAPPRPAAAPPAAGGIDDVGDPFAKKR